jgi:hypothetical protein
VNCGILPPKDPPSTVKEPKGIAHMTYDQVLAIQSPETATRV